MKSLVKSWVESLPETSPVRFVFPVIALMIFVLPIGCMSFRSSDQPHRLTLENSWSRMTTKGDFLGFRRMNRMSPLVLEKLVIEANAIDGMIAYDRGSGREEWRIDLVNGVEGGAQVVGDKLFFGSSNGQFYCVTASTGKVLWTFPVRAETLAAPTIENGVAYFMSGTDVVYALDAETGKQLWLYNRQLTGNLSIRGTTRPVVAGDALLVGFSDGFLVSIRKRDGAMNWEKKLGRTNRFKDVDATPVIDGPDAYVASFDSALYSVKIETGDINWSLDDGAYVPVTLGRDRWSDFLYYSTANGRIHIVDKRNGKISRTIVLKHGIATQVSLFQTYMVYGESEGELMVVDIETGKPVAHFDSGHGLVSRPAIVESTGEAFFISSSANIYAMKIGSMVPAFRVPGDMIGEKW